MKYGDFPAFPVEGDWTGLSMREYFAAAAMHAISTNPSVDVETAARWAVEYADALIAALNKEEK